MAASPPPASWPLYFDDAHDPDDRRAGLVTELVSLFAASDTGGMALLTAGARARAGGSVALALDYAKLVAAASSPDLVASLEVQPDEGLACLACAAHEVRRERDG